MAEAVGQGDFFAIDRMMWDRLAAVGFNEAIAYLVMARGSGPDNQDTKWSVHAIEARTGISRSRAQAAVKGLIERGFVRQDRGGKYPAYTLLSNAQYMASRLTDDQARLLTVFSDNEARSLPTKGGKDWPVAEPYTTALQLMHMGYLANVSRGRFHRLPIDDSSDLIWLPNDLVDGAAGEVSPLEMVRQTADRLALRMLCDLYSMHELRSDAGVHWFKYREDYERRRVGEYAEFVVWGFRRISPRAYASFFEPYMTGEIGPDKKDTGEGAMWASLNTLQQLGLVETIPHLIEADTREAEIVYPLAENGLPAEQRLFSSAYNAAICMTTDAQLEAAHNAGFGIFAPVLKHVGAVELVGLLRLKYRPRTSKTSAWYGRQAEWIELAKRIYTTASAAANVRSTSSARRA